ncbi:UDP-N-acetylmuramoyl-L-alanyl-D-glutamate--2,6-diaminopimelate ligase [Enterobacteriaceae endosymbiont of Donacia tomentosa]|uniref:UDP-N-acetylmuramoyl-L-alanyl-D-glutamate--2, 6-diaminopimelate ligase n=1 Tax=Enterobacteriaceae endosymbiont of Donacia tomentosa TaxID=2675787 RepID=UPI00145732F8|nr:UDP-N-acetylmuramoyl-L-alanyl-D-glutamate--2,6-diaminopimelate ligase [Enterobacteriaceae endosymbiont of Donacia tomentosa]
MNINKITLQKLLKNYINHNLIKHIFINKIVLDSRHIKGKNCLFIAIKGHKNDGRNFIDDAINNGAAAVLTYTTSNLLSYNIIFKNFIPIIFFPNLHKYISYFADILYDHPSKKIPVVGVTGTNGKTSVTNFLMQWTHILGKNPAILSTIGNGFYKKLKLTNNTTDSAVEIQSTLKYFVDKKSDIVFMEVSSHGLDQFRVANVIFSTGIFTNLSRDHLDYHLNMKNYELTKWKFFSDHQIKTKIINIDDNVGLKWFKRLSTSSIPVMTKKISYKSNLFFQVKNINFLKNKTIITFNSSWGHGKINTVLLGYFNVINVILSMTTLLSLNFSLKELLKTSYELKPIIGRMEKISLGKMRYPTIIIDYAHTPDALKNILLTIQLYCQGKIWCIFGCGGERDIGKRHIMGYIANKFSDYTIITSDNSRTENTADIIKDILKGCYKLNNTCVILNRTKAIYYAIFNAYKEDTILIAGKGHENYQIIGNKIFHYSDHQIIKNILEKI